MFDPCGCLFCDGSVGRTYAQQWQCEQCGGSVTRHARRKHFLWALLLARNSCFKRFTYFSGGMAGSVSDTEDILDRILGFL